MQSHALREPEAETPIESRPDAAIVAMSLQNPAAFGVLFDRHWNEIFKFCYYRLGDWHQAEDAASQVFIKAFDNLSAFDHRHRDDSFRCWLFGIARHAVATIRRSSRRHPTATIDEATGVEDQGGSPEDQAIEAEALWQLRSLLDQLPSDQRELMELRLAGLTSAEIARLLGRSHDAIRKAQSRVVISLREYAAQHPAMSNGPTS